MLTKSDLSQIQKIIRQEIGSDDRDFRREFQSELKLTRMRIEERLDEIENKLKDVDIQTNEVRLGMNSLRKEVRYIRKTVDLLVKLADEADVKLQRRVLKIETHLGLTPTQ